MSQTQDDRDRRTENVASVVGGGEGNNVAETRYLDLDGDGFLDAVETTHTFEFDLTGDEAA